MTTAKQVGRWLASAAAAAVIFGVAAPAFGQEEEKEKRKLRMPSISAPGSVGKLLPEVSTLPGKRKRILDASEPTDYAIEKSEEGKGLDTSANIGALDDLILRMPAVEKELEALLAPVADRWPHPTPDPYKIRVRMAGEYGAVTYADGTILMSIGALGPLEGPANFDPEVMTGYVQSDQELQYLLGHEYAHYALGHHNKTDTMDNAKKLVKTLVGVYSEVSVLRRVRYTGKGQNGQIVISDKRGLKDDINSALGKYEQAEMLQRQVLAASWNRGQEDFADALSYDLMASAGLQGSYYDVVFKKLHQQQTLTQQLAAAVQTSLQETTQRILSDETFAAAVNGQGQQQAEKLFEDFQKKTLAKIIGAVSNWFGATHRRPDVRSGGMSKYEQRLYPDYDPFDAVEETRQVIQRIHANPTYRDAIRVTRLHDAAVEAHGKGDLVQARALITQALGTSYGGQTAILYRAGVIARASGNVAAARDYFTRATKIETANPRAYRELAAVLIDQGQYPAVEGVITLAEKRKIERDYFLPTRILMQIRQGSAEAAAETLNTCYATQKDILITECEVASDGIDMSALSKEQQDKVLAKRAKRGPTSVIGELIGNATTKSKELMPKQ